MSEATLPCASPRSRRSTRASETFEPTAPETIAYKIVEITPGGVLKTLFHGMYGNRVLEPGTWYRAVEKMVDDGGTRYLSGFHVLPTYEECEQYLERFKDKSNKRIVACRVKRLRPKEHSPSNVWLARWMCVLNGFT